MSNQNFKDNELSAITDVTLDASRQNLRKRRLMTEEVEDLEKGLEGLKPVMDLLGFGVISETARTITFSPRGRSALARAGNLIFDISIFETKFIQQRGGTVVKAKDHILEEFSLVVTLNNESEAKVALFGVMNGSEVNQSFKGFIGDVINNRIADIPQPIKEELSRTFLEGMSMLRENPQKLIAAIIGQ